MNFVDAVQLCLSKYATFSGRASRPEFWWFCLFQFLVMLTLNFMPSIVASLGMLLLLLPSLAVSARRLHDIGMSGWWLLLSLTGVGGLVLLVLWAMPSKD